MAAASTDHEKAITALKTEIDKTNAERQRAYRERQKQKLATLLVARGNRTGRVNWTQQERPRRIAGAPQNGHDWIRTSDLFGVNEALGLSLFSPCTGTNSSLRRPRK